MTNLVCRNCGSGEVASIDRYLGTCRGAVVLIKGELEFEPGGYTEINWDTCQQVGWQCESCGEEEYTQEGEDDLDALMRLVSPRAA